jgi:hypothetical protein
MVVLHMVFYIFFFIKSSQQGDKAPRFLHSDFAREGRFNYFGGALDVTHCFLYGSIHSCVVYLYLTCSPFRKAILIFFLFQVSCSI